MTSDYPAIKSDQRAEINSYFDLICVGETKIGGSNRLTSDSDPDQIRSRLVKRALISGPAACRPEIIPAYIISGADNRAYAIIM